MCSKLVLIASVWLSILIHLSECKPNIGKVIYSYQICPLPNLRSQHSSTVYILTDDQDIKLGGLANQTVVKQLLADKGLSFSNAFVTTPVCCPSRYDSVSYS